MSRNALARTAVVGVGLLVVTALVVGFLAYKQVPEGHQGVTAEWGAVTGETLEPGAHWKTPVAQGVQNVEIRPRTYTMSATQGEGERQQSDAVTVQTVNGTTVDVDVTVRYRIAAESADTFVVEWNDVDQMEQRLIRPTIRSELRDEAAQVRTSEVYTSRGRELLAQAAREALNTEFDDEPVVLEAVQVRNVDLPDSIDQALNEKAEAEQRVQVEQRRVQQEEARAEQRRVRARAEADVIETRGEALQENPVVLRARLIDAYGNGTVFVTDGNQSLILDTGSRARTANGSTGTA
jgi:regulator of protease activity HflC (stomatin/prohibitin superfamily)